MRLDSYIAANFPDISRSRARALIESGAVCVNSREIRKSAYSVSEGDDVCVETDAIPFVSRGGIKLAAALDTFGVSPKGLVCADIGASTGGFTDCLLKGGAERVYAVDSGIDQLVPSLRSNERVISMEHFNARSLSAESFGELCDMAVADLSFISQSYVLIPIASILKMSGVYIGLIKPQFECGPGSLGKSGIVRDPREHCRAIEKILEAAAAAGFCVTDLMRSPISGGDGNTEFLYMSHKDGSGDLKISPEDIRTVVYS